MENKIKQILTLLSLNGDKYIKELYSDIIYSNVLIYNINDNKIKIYTTDNDIKYIAMNEIWYDIPELSLIEKATIITNLTNQKENFINQQIDSVINTLSNNCEDEDI